MDREGTDSLVWIQYKFDTVVRCVRGILNRWVVEHDMVNARDL